METRLFQKGEHVAFASYFVGYHGDEWFDVQFFKRTSNNDLEYIKLDNVEANELDVYVERELESLTDES